MEWTVLFTFGERLVCVEVFRNFGRSAKSVSQIAVCHLRYEGVVGDSSCNRDVAGLFSTISLAVVCCHVWLCRYR